MSKLGRSGSGWATEYLYADDGNVFADEDKGWWFSFDGIGRVWYDSLAEAKDQTGLEPHPIYGHGPVQY